ncbi:amidase family protein [Gimesia algae]|uniref:Glutamyl-tRNA(Gln) amidotransferase subunit A n=1 Tax=Gimesia algae TaxID=2527971 RepID=A0A517V763_9PLAN|nr:amidase family protein [Gimesia algae]QDT88842.1 Glutamyl-tRNA(Gln) amidotransferase subunit A [Gimesia algae]
MNRLGRIYGVLFTLMASLLWGRLFAGEDNTPRLRKLDFSPFQNSLDHFSSHRFTEIEDLLLDATILDLQAALQTGKLSSEELTLFFLDRIQRFDENLRSYVELNPNALTEARAADASRVKGIVRSQLHGIPINLKDNINTKSPLHTTGGSQILLNHSPASDAILVTKLREAGAIILGKASLSEFAGALTMDPTGANAVSGAGVNPYDPELEVSGSSSGSAISTTAYLTTASVGTETSGSLISPASQNGCVSMKPSLGMVSGRGVIPLIRFQDSAGPITRNVTDAAIMLGAIDTKDIDYLSGLNRDALKDVSVGILRDEILWSSGPSLPLEFLSDQHAIMQRIDQGLEKSHAIPHTIQIPPGSSGALNQLIFMGLAQDTVGYLMKAGAPVSSLTDLRDYNAQQPEIRVPYGQLLVHYGCKLIGVFADQVGSEQDDLAKQYEQLALQLRKQAAATLTSIFGDNEIDLIVSLANDQSALYSTAGYPAITIPLGLDDAGSPIGVTFIGKQGEDGKLLSRAFAFEQTTKYRINPGAPYRHILKSHGIVFRINSPGIHFGNSFTLTASSKLHPEKVIEETLTGLISDIQARDLNQDGTPELFIFINDDTDGESLLIYSADSRTFLQKIVIPELTDTSGYHGKDDYSLTDTTLIRTFPLDSADAGEQLLSPDKFRKVTYRLNSMILEQTGANESSSLHSR